MLEPPKPYFYPPPVLSREQSVFFLRIDMEYLFSNALTMFNRSTEVIVVDQVDTLINFCQNMVRFRIRPDFFGLFLLFLICMYFSVRFLLAASVGLE